MTENRPFSRKITILGNFDPLRANQDIEIFLTFGLFKSHAKRQLCWNRHVKTPILSFLHLPTSLIVSVNIPDSTFEASIIKITKR